MVQYCLDCGESVDPDDRFCYYCGEELPGAEPADDAIEQTEDQGRREPPVGGSDLERERGEDRYCLDCGEQARPEDRFCYFCGERLPISGVDDSPDTGSEELDYCPDCGTSVEPHDRFCYYCGERL